MAKIVATDVQRTELLEVIGECLHAWSAVELEVANLYMIFHGIKRNAFSHPVRSAYEAVISLEVRLAMLMAYAEADEDLNGEYLQHLLALSARVAKLYKKRHQVAHFSIVSRPINSGYQVLIRPFFTWEKFLANKGTELNAEQITSRVKAFVELAFRIRRHVQHVGALRRLPPEYYVQAGDLAFPPLGPADLNPAVAPPPPLPSRE